VCDGLFIIIGPLVTAFT